MRLRADQLSDILSTLNRNSTHFATDPRRAPRMRVQATAEITICPPALLNFSVDPVTGERTLLDSSWGRSTPDVVQIQDISARGVSFFYRDKLQIGDQFVLHLPHTFGDPVHILCTVARTRQALRNQWSIGAEFTCVVACPSPHPSDNRVERIQRSILA